MPRSFAIALLLTTVSALPAAAAQPPECAGKPCAFMNTSLPPEARAKDLVARMTLEEKAAQMGDNAPAIPRLGLLRYAWWNEVLHGLARAGHATVYPQAIGLAATWDTDLMGRIGDAIAVEGRANHNEALRRDPTGTDRYFGVNYWSPNINIYRDPRWGRGQETYGEDPYLTGKMAVAFIDGIQGDDPTYYKGVATPKHFVVHSGPEPLRHGFNVPVSKFDLEDTYTPAFRAAIADGKAYSMMCAYNAVDGYPMCQSPLMRDKVRGQWGLKGFIVTDCDSVDDMVRGHKRFADHAAAAAASVKSGADLDCGSSYNALPEAVRRGLISEAEIDVSLQRLMVARIRMGLIDGGKYDNIPYSEVNSPAHRALALETAEKAMVLLANSGNILPLRGSEKVAVIGPNAYVLQSLEGNYTGSPVNPSLPLDAMREAFGAANVNYAPGSTLIAGMAMPVPPLYLSTDGGTGNGLKGEYFDNLTFDGAPVISRTDPIINFDFYHTAPEGLKPLAFSVRWTGQLTPPAAGAYKLGFRMTPRPGQPQPDVKVWLDGQLIITPDMVGQLADVTFSDTKAHDIRIDFVRATDDRASSLDWVAPPQVLLDDAVKAANASDVIVAFVGLSPDLEGEEMKVDYPGFDGGDRTSLGLPAAQQTLLEAVKATGKKLVVVQMTGGPISDPWIVKNADAVLQAWYPGEEGGHAIANTLTGKTNPGGRLPYTVYADINDLPAFGDYSMTNRTYRYFKGPVLYPFGAGLSYTTFTYASPVLSAAKVKAGKSVTVSVKVSNSGSRDGDEVVQIYLDKPATATSAIHALAAFQRVHLKAGETRTVSLTLDARALSQVDARGDRKVLPGSYTVHAGGGQPGTAPGASTELTVTGSASVAK